MKMDIEMDCPSCVGRVFHAIGDFISQDDGVAQIIAVSVSEEEAEAEAEAEEEEEDGHVLVDATISWDGVPTFEQVSLFREVWDDESGFQEAVILHKATGIIVSEPVDRSHELN